MLTSFYCLLLLAQAPAAETEFQRLPPVIEETVWSEAPQIPVEAFPASEVVELPATEMYLAWLAAGGNQGFGALDADVRHTWLLGYGDAAPLEITPGFGFHLWSGPRGLDLPGQVYDAYLDLRWRPVELERGGVSVGLTPGFYGDFERVDGDTFQLTGWMLGNYRLNDQWNLLGGVAYVRQLQSNVLPIGGVVWTPDEDTCLEFVVPRPRVARRYYQDEQGSRWWFIGGQLGGGAWAIADTPDDNVLVSYSDLRLLAGVESFSIDGREWSVALGYVFDRQIAVDNYVVDSPTGALMIQGLLAF